MNISPAFLYMDIMKEYSRVRANILKRAKRVEAAGFGKYIPKVNLPKAENIKQAEKYLARALKLDKRVSVKAAKEKKEAKRIYERERYLDKTELKQDTYNYMHGIRKWLKRLGKSRDLVNRDNISVWIEYIESRRAVQNDKGKYKFDKYVEDIADKLTDEEEQVDIETVFNDFESYMDEQHQLVEDADKVFAESDVKYDSEAIANKFFNRR